MNKESKLSFVTGRLQVFFEDPFWVGVFERIDEGKLSVCKVTFGAEPKDYDIQKFIRQNYFKLRFSNTVDVKVNEKAHINPKRLQRDVKKQIQNVGVGTKSQQALKLQQEQTKIERKEKSRKQREQEKERLFELKQQKKRQKQTGR